jgi:molecular chaperone GrpE
MSDNERCNPRPDQGKSGPDAADATQVSLADQLEAAVADRDAFQQKWLLAVADIDNYRRRMQKEAEQDRLYAALPLARDLLPALDNLRRALEAARVSNDAGRLIEGVQMVARQIEDIFGKHSIVPIEALDQPFDPNLHQALQQLPNPEKPPMTVLAECERGYRMHDRIVRPSTVIVSAPPPD